MKNNTINKVNFVLLLLILSFGLNKAFSQNKEVLPAPINTAKFTEYAPSVSADGRTLIFESDRQGDWKLFESHRNGKNWSVPIPIPKITTTFFEKAPLGGPCLSYDGNLLLFSANGKDSDGHEDIYYSIREKGGWSSPMNFGSTINTIDHEGYPSLSADGKYLYFARAKFVLGDKKDSQQRCYRIMRAERKTDGKWKTAVELPSPVNLVCEKSPRIMADGKTLMFSSIRKGGQGSFDIYKSELQENGTWTEPIPLDFLNTAEPDQFVAIPACGEMMYYSMNGDIYTATIPIEAVATIQGYITDSTTNNTLAAKIMVSEIGNPTKIIAEFDSDAFDGRFSAVLKPNRKYIFEISKSGFYRKISILDLSEKRDCETYEQDFKLIPLGGISEITEIYKLSFLAIDAQTNLTIPASFEATELTSRQSIALQYNTQTLQNQGSFRLKQDYSIEASMKGYKNSSLSLRIDDKQDLLPVSIIKLVPISSNFTIKGFDAATNELLKDTKVTIKEIATNQVASVKTNLETGECKTNLFTGKKYKITVSSNFYEDSEQTIIKSDTLKELLVKLIPKKVYTANLLAIDLERDEPIDASFIVTLEKTGKIFKADNVKAKSYFPVPMFQDDNLKIEVIADGFATARTILPITNIALGKQDQYKINLTTDKYTLTIKVLDAETQKPINDAILKFVEIKTSEVKQATKNNTQDFTVQLKRSGFYELNIKAEDYVELPNQKIDTVPEGNAINFMLSKKKRIPVNFAIFDVTTNKPLKASISVRLEKEKKSFSFKDEVQVAVKVAEREIFTVETSAEGYKPIQSTFNMADFNMDKKYLFPIRLEKALYVLNIKAINKTTNEAETTGEYRITDDISKPIKMRSLRKYNLFLYAIDATKKNKVSANFKVYDAGKEIIASGKTDILREQIAVSLIEKTNYTIEITAIGYKYYEGTITPDSSMRNASIASWLVKDDSKLTFRVLDAQTHKIIDKCVAKLIDVKSSQELILVKFDDEFSAELSPVANYMLEIEAKGYAKYINRIEPNSDRKKNIQLVRTKEQVVAKASTLSESTMKPNEKSPTFPAKDFEKIEKGKAIVLNNVYFEQSSFIMQRESYPELDKVVLMLKTNPQTKIEIGGYTDNIGEQRLNLALSENRAKVILNYFVSKGIDENRLLYKGYGGSKSVAPNDSEENKKKNRRVEIVGIQ